MIMRQIIASYEIFFLLIQTVFNDSVSNCVYTEWNDWRNGVKGSDRGLLKDTLTRIN